MSIFDALNTTDDIKEDTDVLGGSFGPVNSGAYHATISMAYTEQAKSGALALKLTFVTDDNKTINQDCWMTSGNEKGNKNYYINKNDQSKNYLPGFTLANGIALLAAGKEIAEIVKETGEDKVIKLYNFTAKKELPTQKNVITGLLNKSITLGVLKQKVDKNVQNSEGKWVPGGESREVNEVSKVFRRDDGMTVAEILAKADEANFLTSWIEKFTDSVIDKTTKDVSKPGLPGASQGKTDKPATSLFATS